MKEIKDYVCTFPQAKRLKELGVEQESLFCIYTNGEIILGKDPIALSAFTSQELAEIIKKYVSYDTCQSIGVCDNEWLFLEHIENYEFIPYDHFQINGENEAQARAEFLIHLLENIYLLENKKI